MRVLKYKKPKNKEPALDIIKYNLEKSQKQEIARKEFYNSFPDWKKLEEHRKGRSDIKDDCLVPFKRQNKIIDKLISIFSVIYDEPKEDLYEKICLEEALWEEFFPDVFNKFLTPKLLEEVDIENIVVKKFFKCANCKHFAGHRNTSIDYYDKHKSKVISFSGVCWFSEEKSENLRTVFKIETMSNDCCYRFKPVTLIEHRISCKINKIIEKMEKEQRYSINDYHKDLKTINFCRFVNNGYQAPIDKSKKVITLYEEIEEPLTW